MVKMFSKGCRIAVVLLIFVSIISAAGCKAKEEKLSEINVSYVKSPFNLPLIIMNEKGFLDKAFAEKGIKVNYHEITSGAKQSEAIAAGSLDIASVINTVSVILANAAGNPVEIFSGFSRPQKMFTILTTNDDIKTIGDLRGKSIAGPKGTVLHELLVAALKKEGMTVSDVNYIQMNIPNATAAMMSKKVDCALAAAASVVAAEKAGARILTTCEGYVSPLLVSAAGKKFAEKHPSAIDLYLSVYKDTLKWISENEKEAIEIGARVQDISIEDAYTLYRWSGFTEKLIPSDLEAIDYDIGFMLETEMIDRSVDKMTFVSPKAMKE